MRRTARPFVTEYKSRSSKSSAPHSPNIGMAHQADPIPSFLHRGPIVIPQTNAEDAYQVALKAADALFSKGSPVIIPQEQAPLAIVQEPRVLPSLLDKDDALTVQSGKDGEKARRSRKVSTAQSPSSAGQEKQSLRPRKAVEPDVAVEPAEEISTSRRERSSIQNRWVLGTELKSGQKWKRRLCKAAR
jgi:hypothetical protein